MFRVINVVLTVYITYRISFNVDQYFDIYILYELFKKSRILVCQTVREVFHTSAYKYSELSKEGKLAGYIQAKISQLRPSNTQLMQTELPILVNQWNVRWVIPNFSPYRTITELVPCPQWLNVLGDRLLAAWESVAASVALIIIIRLVRSHDLPWDLRWFVDFHDFLLTPNVFWTKGFMQM